MKKILAAYGIETDEDVILVGKELNMLWAINRATRCTRIISKIPDEEFLTYWSFCAMTLCDGKIILAPFNAKNIWSYDLSSDEWSCLGLPLEIQSIERKFCGAVTYNDKVILLGYRYAGIAVVDIKTNEVMTIDIPVKHNNDFYKYCFLHWDYVFDGSCIITPVSLKNVVLKINLDDYSIEEIEIGDKNNKYVSITFDGQNYWLAPREGRNVIKWDGHDRVETYQLPATYKDDEMYFSNSFFYDGKIYFGSFKKMSYVFDPNDVENGIVLDMDIQFQIPFENGHLVQGNDGIFRIIGDELEPYDYMLDEDEFVRYIEKNIDLSKANMLREGAPLVLEDFLKLL